MKTVSVVIPVYKSTDSLKILVQELIDLFRTMRLSFEIILVNDSPEYMPTRRVVEELRKKNKKAIRCVEMRKNHGQEFAVMVGLFLSDGEYVVTMDDDLQHSPKEIRRMLDAMKSNPEIDAILAVPPYNKRKHNLVRKTASWALAKVDHVFLGLPKQVVKSSFRMIRSDTVRLMVEYFNASPAISGLLLQITHRVVNLEIKHYQRRFGKSQYKTSRLFKLAFNNIVQESSFPLKLMGITGFAVFILSNLFILVIVIQKVFFSISVPGYASSVALIAFFGGLNLLGLGIIGEYLIRIIKEQRKVRLEDLYIEK